MIQRPRWWALHAQQLKTSGLSGTLADDLAGLGRAVCSLQALSGSCFARGLCNKLVWPVLEVLIVGLQSWHPGLLCMEQY